MVQRPALADYPAGARLPERVLDDYELVWMLRGQATIAARESLTLRPGELLLLPPGFRHAILWDPDRPSRHGYVHFTAADVGRPLPGTPRVRRMTQQDPLAGLCAYLLWLAAGDQADWHGQALAVLGFTAGLIDSQTMPDTEPVESVPPALRAVVDRLRLLWVSDPLPRVGVAELAAAGGLSRGYLNRQFRAHFSLSVGAAVECLRCARAETLLTRTDLTVQAVARRCGYADLSHFSHRFSAVHGVPPSAYRNADTRAPSVLDHTGARRLIRLMQA
jgi:AraC-like DNA-binding protein